MQQLSGSSGTLSGTATTTSPQLIGCSATAPRPVPGKVNLTRATGGYQARPAPVHAPEHLAARVVRRWLLVVMLVDPISNLTRATGGYQARPPLRAHPCAHARGHPRGQGGAQLGPDPASSKERARARACARACCMHRPRSGRACCGCAAGVLRSASGSCAGGRARPQARPQPRSSPARRGA